LRGEKEPHEDSQENQEAPTGANTVGPDKNIPGICLRPGQIRLIANQNWIALFWIKGHVVSKPSFSTIKGPY
jgi:hypothetical protein